MTDNISNNLSSNVSGEQSFSPRLSKMLNEAYNWPTDYMFKFIVPNECDLNVDKLVDSYPVFDLKRKKSSNGRFTGYTFSLNVGSASEIIEIYQQMSKIKGVISL